MEIQDLIQRSYANADRKGFHGDNQMMLQHIERLPVLAEEKLRLKWIWDDTYKVSKLALIMSECAEAIEAIRRGDSVNHAEELADVLIRIGDYCGEFGIELEDAIKAKMLINERRPYKHGKAL